MQDKFLKVPSRFVKTVVGLAAVLGLTFSIGFSGIQAQQPLYLPAEIPLDVDVIYQELNPAPDYTETTQNIILQMTRNHFSEIVFDDDFSSTLLDNYIETLDSSRIYFTQSDIDEFEQYRETLDNLLLEGDINFGYLLFNRYRERLMDRLVYSLKRIEEDSTDFDFRPL